MPNIRIIEKDKPVKPVVKKRFRLNYQKLITQLEKDKLQNAIDFQKQLATKKPYFEYVTKNQLVKIYHLIDSNGKKYSHTIREYL